MANRLLRNIAVSIGAGLAAGFGKTLAARQARPPAPQLYPILTRLEDIESRVTRVELAPAALATPAPEEIEALGTLLSSQGEDIAFLRQNIRNIERRNAEQAEAFGQKVALLEQQVPMSIEARVSARIAELEQRLRGEFHEIQHQTIDAFAQTLEQRVVARIMALEASLVDQSQSIAALREKSLKTDDHLQRLLEAVEKLCVRADAQVQPPASHPQPQPAMHDRRPMEREACPEPELELAFAGTGTGRSPLRAERNLRAPRRFDFRPVGVAIVGLAILGFRYTR